MTFSEVFKVLIWMCQPKNRGILPLKMDGENFMENPMNKWMIWGENPIIFGNIHILPSPWNYQFAPEIPENWRHPKRKQVFFNHPFLGANF